MVKSLFLLLISFTCLGMVSGFGQSALSEKPENRISKFVNTRLFTIAPGAVVLVARGKEILYYEAIGKNNVEKNTKMTKDAVFRIGSLTKPFTATAILMLVEENKISLDDTIQQYIPDFPIKAYPVTIEHLLTNTSGIKNYFEIKNPAKEREHYTPREGISYFEDEPLEFEPGTQYRYSNSNYYLLGYIIEKVSGLTYPDFIRQRIFNVVGMPHSCYGQVSNRRSQLATGYSRLNGKIENAALEEITSIYSAGGLLSDAMDLLHWHQALFDGKLISKELLKKATSRFTLKDGRLSEYGYGWFISGLDSMTSIEHSGSTDGYQTDFVYIPEKDIRVITLFNCYKTDREWVMATNDIARLAMGKPLQEDIQLSEKILRQYTGTYKHNEEWQMIFTMKGSDLYVRCPKAGLPDVRLYALRENYFYTKETPIKFELLKQADGSMLLVTYNNSGKDAEWKRIDKTSGE